MAIKSTSTYTDAQVAIILEAIAANGNVANAEIAKALAADPRMNVVGEDGKPSPRKPQGITAKMARMKEAYGFTYERKEPTTKDGKPVTKKTELVERIATLAGVAASKLDNLDKASKGALETLVSAFERTGTDG